MKALLIILAVSAGFAHAKDTYKIDAAHTQAVFKVDHMGFSNTYGIMSGAEGQFILDEKKPEASSFDVSFKVDTLNTLDKKRDDHLKGPDFFNVKEFPKITVKSKSIKKKSADEFDVTADLTLHGVTKPISFVVKRNKTGKDPWGNQRAGATTTINLKRTAHNMAYMSKPGEIGDDVELFVNVEGVK